MGNITSSSSPRKDAELIEELVLSEILPKLPVKSLVRFKCVSKKWFDRISYDTSFIEAHIRHHRSQGAKLSSVVVAMHDRSKQKPRIFMLHGNDQSPKLKKLNTTSLSKKAAQSWQDIEIVGSSNGLVLLCNSFCQLQKELVLWNPATRESRFLSQPIALQQEIQFSQIYPISFFGLGFDDKNKDHKVLRVMKTSLVDKSVNHRDWLDLQLFSKNNGSWKKLKPLKIYKLLSSKSGVSLNGVLYFLAFKEPCSASNNNSRLVMSFDFSDEKVKEFAALPKCYPVEEHMFNEFSLSKWKENSLALVASSPTEEEAFDFWVMVKDSNNVLFWSKHFSFNFYYQMCGLWLNQFPMVQKKHRFSVELHWLDPNEDGNKKSVSKLAKLRYGWYFCEAYDYFPSLFSVYPHSVKEKIDIE